MQVQRGPERGMRNANQGGQCKREPVRVLDLICSHGMAQKECIVLDIHGAWG